MTALLGGWIRPVLCAPVLAALLTFPLHAQDADSNRAALGLTVLATSGYLVRESETATPYGESGPFLGVGAELRVFSGNVWSVSFVGEWMPKSNEGVVHESGSGAGEFDFYLTRHGPVRLYVGGFAGVEQTVYQHPNGGPALRATRALLGPAGGSLVRLTKHLMLGLAAEYRLGSTPYLHEYSGGGEGPAIETPGRLVGRTRVMWLL